MKYHLARGEEQLGTFNDLDVSAGLRQGRFKPTDLCWAEGMAEWLPLGSHLQELNVEAGAPMAAGLPALAALREEIRQEQALRLDLATRGQRLGAKLIDWTMLLVPFFVFLMALMDAPFKAEILAQQDDPAALMEALQKQVEKMQAAGEPTILAMSWVIVILMIVNTVLLGVRGQTIGKLLLGIHIVRAQDGSRAGFVKAVVLRCFLFAVIESIRFLGPALLVGDVLLIFRADRRCLHDLVADTLVTKRPR